MMELVAIFFTAVVAIVAGYFSGLLRFLVFACRRPIGVFCPPARPYFCTEELKRLEIYRPHDFVDSAQQANLQRLGLFICSHMSNDVDDQDGQRPLIAAAKAGRVDAVELLLRDGHVDIGLTNRDGDTALIVAAAECDEVLRRLLAAAGVRAGAYVDARNRVNDTPLIVAARNGRGEAVKALIVAGADVNARNADEESALLEAAKRDHTEIVDDLKQAGAVHPGCRMAVTCWRLKEAGLWELSAVIDATRGGQLARLMEYSRCGWDWNQRDAHNRTVIVEALHHDQVDVVEWLLAEDNIDARVRDNNGDTALRVAVQRGHDRFIEPLLDAGADVGDLHQVRKQAIEDRGDRFIAESFVGFARNGQVDLLAEYLDAGMRVDVAHLEQTALIAASGACETKSVELLLDHGPNIELRNRSGLTALGMAVLGGCDEVAKLLRGWGAVEHEAPAFDLLDAIEAGDLPGVKRSLEAGASADQRDTAGQPALTVAVRRDNIRILKLLLAWRADPDARDADDQSPLMTAAGLGRVELAAALLDAAAAVDATSGGGFTALLRACAQHDVEMIELLIEHGADVNGVDPKASTPLQAAYGHEGAMAALRRAGASEGADGPALLKAASQGDARHIRALLAQGNPRSVTDIDGNTPLMLAAGRGWPMSVDVLIDGDTDLDRTNNNGDTALMLAAAAGRVAVVTLLLDGRADKDLRNNDGKTALLQAAMAAHGPVVQLLAERGANPSLAAAGTTVLVEACRHGPVEAVQALLRDSRADYDQRAGSGMSPLMAATLSGHEDIVEFLEGATAGRGEAQLFTCVRREDLEGVQAALEHDKIDLGARDERGGTALLEACSRGQASMVKMLLDHGASPADRLRSGTTALELAAASGSIPTVKLLTESLKSLPAGSLPAKSVTAALLIAVDNGFVSAIRPLIKVAGAQVDGNGCRRVPLIVAAATGRLDVVRTLLDLEADINKPSARGLSALATARLRHHTDVVELLQRRGAKPDDPKTKLLVAAGDGDLAMVRRLLAEHGVGVLDARDADGSTALMRACAMGRGHLVEFLLSELGDETERRQVTERDEEGRTALMSATVRGDSHVVRRLVEAGAVCAARSKRGRTALIEAAHHGRPEVIDDLHAGCKTDQEWREIVTARDDGGTTALDEAYRMPILGRQREYELVIELLAPWVVAEDPPDDALVFLDAARVCDVKKLAAMLKLKLFEVDGPSWKGLTALMLAVEAGCVEGARMLIDDGADVDRRGRTGVTPLMLAVRGERLNVLRLLLSRHAMCDQQDANGETALLSAVKTGSAAAVRELIRARANVDLADVGGRTPLMQAVRDDRPDLVGPLRDAGASNHIVDDFGRSALTFAHLRGESTGLTEAELDSDWMQLRNLRPVERLLLKSGARRGWTEAELLLAARTDDGEAVMRFLEEGAVVHAPDLDGNTALSWACHHSDERLAKELMCGGANPHVRNLRGRTPLMELLRTGVTRTTRDRWVAPRRKTSSATLLRTSLRTC